VARYPIGKFIGVNLLGNPAHKGLVAEAEKWFHSSAAQYTGGSGPLEIDPLEW